MACDARCSSPRLDTALSVIQWIMIWKPLSYKILIMSYDMTDLLANVQWIPSMIYLTYICVKETPNRLDTKYGFVPRTYDILPHVEWLHGSAICIPETEPFKPSLWVPKDLIEDDNIRCGILLFLMQFRGILLFLWLKGQEECLRYKQVRNGNAYVVALGWLQHTLAVQALVRPL